MAKLNSGIKVGMLLVNTCNSQDIPKLHKIITSQAILFDSRIRGNWKEYCKCEARIPHWKVEGATYSTLRYTLFCPTNEQKREWLSHKQNSKPRTDVLLYTYSVSGINMKQIREFTCKRYKDLLEDEYMIPKVHNISKNVYHPSRLFPHQMNKLAFVLLYVLSSTWYL